MRQLTDYEIKINREAEDKVRKALDQFFDIVEEQGFDDKAIASNLLIVAIERVYELSDSDEQFFRIVLSIAKEVPNYMKIRDESIEDISDKKIH